MWQRFARHRLALASVAFILICTLVIFPLASVVAPIPPNKVSLREVSQPPSGSHLLGTDSVGRDYWSRLVYGGRVSLSVGLVAVVIYMTIGIVLGSIAGYLGGWVDSVIMRITDTVMAFPTLVILIALVAIMGPGLVNSMVAIGVLGWTGVARLVRGQILSIRETDFVTAARAMGVPKRRIVVRHIFPNLVGPVTVAASFGVANAILIEAGLSFLGLGAPMPTPSWGNMLNSAQSLVVIERMQWLWLPPGAMITLVVLAINFVGDGLRDALDPRRMLD
jgi:peptide/nickel transport system permease protein